MLPTQLILERLYRVPRRSRRERLQKRLSAFQRKVGRWLDHQSWGLALAAASMAIIFLAHGYYYNRLLILEYDVQVAWAKVEAGQQKRNHVVRNLTQLMRYYTRYEKDLMKDVTKMRTMNRAEASDGGGGDALGQLLGRLNAVAEQYPNLHLTNTVQQFTSTIVSTESEIAAYIIGYNDSANIYSSALNTFPARIFGKVLGFKAYPFYKPENPAVLEYEELKL